MIEISRIYNPKNEYLLISKTLRYARHYICGYDEYDLTFVIDKLVDRWKRLQVIPDTRKKLYRFAITYKYRMLQEIKPKYKEW